MIVVASAPGLVGLLFLAADIRNLPLVALCLLPLGPALSAAIYAMHYRSSDLADLHPARGSCGVTGSTGGACCRCGRSGSGG